MRKLLVAAVLGLLAAPILLATEIYRSVNEEHGVEYSDTPSPGAQRIEIQAPQIVPSTPPLPGPNAPAPEIVPETAPVSYERIAISNPANDETLRDNAGNVLVSISLSPALQTAFGHRLVLLVDGKPFGAPGTATNFALTEVARGAHTLQAQVVGQDGGTLAQSPASSFFLHKHSIKLPKPATSPPPAAPK